MDRMNSKEENEVENTFLLDWESAFGTSHESNRLMTSLFSRNRDRKRNNQQILKWNINEKEKTCNATTTIMKISLNVHKIESRNIYSFQLHKPNDQGKWCSAFFGKKEAKKCAYVRTVFSPFSFALAFFSLVCRIPRYARNGCVMPVQNTSYLCI